MATPPGCPANRYPSCSLWVTGSGLVNPRVTVGRPATRALTVPFAGQLVISEASGHETPMAVQAVVGVSAFASAMSRPEPGVGTSRAMGDNG